MSSSFFSFLFLLLTGFIIFPQTNSQCAENIYTNQDFLTCGTNHQLDSSMSAFPSFLQTNSYTQISVEIIFNPISTCSPSSSTQDLFIITVEDSLGQEIKVMNFVWTSTVNYQAYAEMGSTKVPINWISSTSFAVNNWIEVVTSINFDTQILHAGVNAPGLFAYKAVDTTVSFYSSALKFDSNTKFYFCSSLPSSSSGANFDCSIKTLNIWYTFQPGDGGLRYFGALSPTYLAYYRMDEGTGTSIQDATGTLTSGSFGSTAPIWPSSTVGVEFASTSASLELPVFPTTASGNAFTTHSFTINFWFKFNSASGTANIFRYTTTPLDYDNFGFYIDSKGALTIGMANQASISTSTIPLSPSVWTLITASYSIGSSSSPTYNVYYLYQDSTFAVFNLVSSPSLSSGPYRVILGGSNSFLGTIAHLRILSPASNNIHDLTTCSSSSSTTPTYLQCALNLGMSDPKTCISYPCGGSNCDRCSRGTYDSCLSCSSIYEYSNGLSLCDVSLIPSVSPVIEPAQTTTSTLSKLYSALTKGGSSGFSAAIAGKIFSNIKYLDIGYSLELQEALKSWQSSFISMGLDLELPQGLQDKLPELGVPPTFEKYNVSSDFLINFWEGIVVLIIIAGLFGVIRAIEHFTKESKHKILPKIRKARFMLQNLLNSQLYGVFADVVMYSVLNYRTQSLGEGLASLGFVFSALLLIITACALAFGLDLLVQYQRLKTNRDELEQLLQRNQGSSITFEDFKDASLLRQAFLFLLVLRDILFSFILTTLFEHPLAQTLLILILNLAIIAILFINQPFKERFGFLQQILYEIVTLAVNVAVIILAAKDQAESTAYDLRQSTGKFIIITNLVFNFTVIAFLVYGLFVTFKEAYQEYKAKKAKKVSPIVLNTSSSPILNSSDTQTKKMMEMDSIKNQNHTENSIEMNNRRIRVENSRFSNDMNKTSGSHLFGEAQNQTLRKQQNLIFNSNSIGVKDNILQSQIHQTPNFHSANNNFGLHNGPTSETQNQQKIEIHKKNSLSELRCQPPQRKRIKQMQKNEELEIPQDIHRRRGFPKQD